MAQRRPPTLTPLRYHDALEIMRISQRELARILACSVRLTCDWGLGKKPVPPGVVRWLNACVALRKKHPYPAPPSDWCQRDPRFSLKRREARAKAGLTADDKFVQAREARRRARARSVKLPPDDAPDYPPPA